MSLLGASLTIMIGPRAPTPAPVALLEALKDVEVTHDDRDRSGFRLSFTLGRPGQTERLDYPLVRDPLLQPFSRVRLIVTLFGVPTVLIDGVITHQEVLSGDEPGAALLNVVGEDVSILMDLEHRKVAHPLVSDAQLVRLVLGRYAANALPRVTAAPDNSQPPPRQAPFQDATDLGYVQRLARRYGYVFAIVPGLVNQAYWGPRIRQGVPQRALSVDLGSATNVQTIDFRYNALSPITVSGGILDRSTNRIQQVRVTRSTGPTLSRTSALTSQRQVRKTALGPTSGLTTSQARARAQGRVNAAADATLVAQGSLDTLRYGAFLEARGLVGVRGAGQTFDGSYYVQRVTHNLRIGSVTQTFSLLRQGTGAASLVVRT